MFIFHPGGVYILLKQLFVTLFNGCRRIPLRLVFNPEGMLTSAPAQATAKSCT